jgi:hypothetical protein
MSTVVQDLQRATAGINDIETALKSAGAIGESEVVPIEDYDDKIGGLAKTLVQKTITANGTYDPANETPPADGYSEVTVNVADLWDNVTIIPVEDSNGEYICGRIRGAANKTLNAYVMVSSDSSTVKLEEMASGTQSVSLTLYPATYKLKHVGYNTTGFELKTRSGADCYVIDCEEAFKNASFKNNNNVDLTHLLLGDASEISFKQAFYGSSATHVKLNFAGFQGEVDYSGMFSGSSVETIDGISYAYAGNTGLQYALHNASNLVNLNIIQDSVIGNDTDDVTFDLTACTQLDGASFLSRLGTFTGTHTVTINFAADVYSALTQADIDAATAKNYIITHA